MKALPCIVCGCGLDGWSWPNQPLDGLAFSTRGHYGTTAFDPMDGSALEINVCDRCLQAAGAAGRVLHYPAGPKSSRSLPRLGRCAPETPTSADGPEASGLAAQAVQGGQSSNGTNQTPDQEVPPPNPVSHEGEA